MTQKTMIRSDHNQSVYPTLSKNLLRGARLFTYVFCFFLLFIGSAFSSEMTFESSNTLDFIHEEPSSYLSPSCRLNKVGFSRMYADIGTNEIGDGVFDNRANDDLISIINYGTEVVDISGWRLYTDQIGTEGWLIFPDGVSIAPCQEITVIADWNPGLLLRPLPENWFDADLDFLLEGLFADNAGNANWAMLQDPTTLNYISIGNEISPTVLPEGTRLCHADIRGQVPDNFDPCELVFWDDNANQYSETVDCALPTWYTACLPSDLESKSDYSGFGVSCAGGSDGWLKAKAQGGEPPYNFEWFDQANTVIASGPQDSLFGLSAGYYQVNISDVNGYIGTFGTILSEPTPLESQVQLVAPYNGDALSCHNGSDGKAYVFSWSGAVDFVTGVAPYDYVWSNGQTGDTLRNVGPGTYFVTTMGG